MFFQIQNFKLAVIPPQKSINLLTIYPKDNILRDLKLESGLILSTNISDVTVSLLIYNGKLTKVRERKTKQKNLFIFFSSRHCKVFIK